MKNPSDSANWQIETQAVRQAVARSQYGEHSEALYLTSSFIQPDAATAAKRFSGEEDGFIYSRFTNPTVASFEQRLAVLEGTQATIATGSGMSAILLLCLGLLQAGDHVVCSQSVFGATIRMLSCDLAKFGVRTSFVPQTDPAAWKAAITPQTKLLFAETPSNPLTEVCDISALSEIAHAAGAKLAVDNCFCTPAPQRPAKLGADIVVHSGTKYLDGQGRVLAGALCTSSELIANHFMPVLRSCGMSLSAFNAWVVLKGLETLSLRMRAQSQNALAIAQWLETHPRVGRVFYPGLTSHPQHALAMKQQGVSGNGLGGAVLSFELKNNTRTAAFHVIDQTQLCSITANLGDTKTIITHPASTSHGRITPEARQAAGITEGLIRLAVGLEALEDIQQDLDLGLSTL